MMTSVPVFFQMQSEAFEDCCLWPFKSTQFPCSIRNLFHKTSLQLFISLYPLDPNSWFLNEMKDQKSNNTSLDKARYRPVYDWGTWKLCHATAIMIKKIPLLWQCCEAKGWNFFLHLSSTSIPLEYAKHFSVCKLEYTTIKFNFNKML